MFIFSKLPLCGLNTLHVPSHPSSWLWGAYFVSLKFMEVIWLIFHVKNVIFFALALVLKLLCLTVYSRRRRWHPTPVLLPAKSHGWRSLVGCSPWGRTESDTTEQLHFHFSLLCIGEGNGNPLQCSCLENPRDRGARWAAVYGVAQSQTRQKRLSSSNSIF